MKRLWLLAMLFAWLALQMHLLGLWIGHLVNKVCDRFDKPNPSNQVPWLLKAVIIVLCDGLIGVSGVVLGYSLCVTLSTLGVLSPLLTFLFCPSHHWWLANLWELTWHWMAALVTVLFYLDMILWGRFILFGSKQQGREETQTL